MTMYWERCHICGNYIPTLTCWLHLERQICASCCLLCSERNHCSKPVWFPETKYKTFEEVRKVERKVAEEKIQKVLEELLGKLE